MVSFGLVSLPISCTRVASRAPCAANRHTVRKVQVCASKSLRVCCAGAPREVCVSAIRAEERELALSRRTTIGLVAGLALAWREAVEAHAAEEGVDDN
jgi:hypothetical protein